MIGDLFQWQFTDVLVVPVITQQGITGALFVADKLTKVNQGLPYSAQGVAFIESIAAFVGSRWDQDSVLQAMKERLFRTIQVLVETLEARDRYTRGHSENVAGIARAVALNLGLDSDQAENIYLAGILHDIGKIGIPETVLNKLAPLSESERAQIREHPQISRRILEALPEFYPILNIVEQHHERWDGLGYPRNLSGEEIELSARILAVADSFDAMISDRTYQRARTPEEVMKELVNGAGSQWDPNIIDSFIQWWTEDNLLSPIRWNLKFTRNIYKDIMASATKEKIFIVDKDELAGPLSIIFWERVLEVKVSEHLPVLRKALEEWLIQKKIDTKKIKDLVLVVSEMGSNTLKHGKGGEISWGQNNEGTLMILSVDQGDGFNIEKLPQSLLVKGFSTKQSLGYGFSIILEKCKSIVLATDSNGSIILVNCGVISPR
ncbi:MAG: HD domain-containing phosphohydrolase [Carboxydocellales bacterium]